MKNIKIEFTNERIIPASGLAVVGAILGKSDFVKRCNRMDVTPNRSQHQIKNGDILLTYIGMLCMGKPQYGAVHEMDDDQGFYKYALGITRSIPSEETLRQGMDDIGSSQRRCILAENVEMLRMNGIVPSKLPNGFVPVDIDVTPFDNPKTKKEGVSRTYKGYDGYAPRDGKTVYIGSGWKPVTYQTQSGEEKTVTIRTGYEIIERTVDKYGQFLLPADLEANTWWTNTGMTDTEIIENYHAHGECEQFHSEIKTDMDVERLPSGKFETNELVLELTILAYNILRMIGQETIGRRGTKTKHKVRRRRLRTVIGNMIMMASHVTKHAHQLIMGLGKSNIWRYAFAETYLAFADFRF